MRDFLKNHKQELLRILSTVISISTISILWLDYLQQKKECYLAVYLTITIILLAYLYFALFFRKKRLIIIDFIPILLLLTIIIIAIPGLFCFEYNVSQKFLIDLGGLFTFTIGLATIIGIYLALKQVINLNYTAITSFPQLMYRLTKLLKDVINDNEEIKIVSYFVLPGYWQVKNEWLKKDFKDSLKKIGKKVQIVCLTPKEHLTILMDIAKKGTYLYSPREKRGNDIINFQEESEEILKEYSVVNRLSINELPPYYFFITKKRAIIVTPVGLPTINEKMVKEIKKIDVKSSTAAKKIDNWLDSDNTENDRKAKINTLGFETTDQFIINMLLEKFDEYKTKAEADAKEKVEANKEQKNKD